jgi:hypothetical protein
MAIKQKKQKSCKGKVSGFGIRKFYEVFESIRNGEFRFYQACVTLKFDFPMVDTRSPVFLLDFAVSRNLVVGEDKVVSYEEFFEVLSKFEDAGFFVTPVSVEDSSVSCPDFLDFRGQILFRLKPV